MANREIRKIITARKGSIVVGDHFIGRKNFVLDLVEFFYCQQLGQNIAVCGLPRIGKTSLLRHAALKAREDENYDQHTLIVYIDLNADCRGRSTDYIYGWMITKTLAELQNAYQQGVVADTDFHVLMAFANSDHAQNNPLQRLQQFMGEIRKRGLRVKMVLDEFDAIMKSCQTERPDGKTQIDTERLNAFYACLRLLITDNEQYALRVTLISRNKLSEMEPPGVESKLSGVCNHTPVRLFNKKEMRQYWDELKQYDDEGLISQEYIERVERFAGNLPYWLDIANDCVLRTLDEDEEENPEDNLYRTMREQYDSVLNMLDDSCYLEQSGGTLKTKLLQLMVGPRFNLTSDDITKLTDYFVVTQKEQEDGTYMYRSLTPVFEEFLHRRPVQTPIWESLYLLEVKMRNLIKERYLSSFDGDWEAYYNEKFRSKGKDTSSFIAGLRHDRERSRKLFGSAASFHLADYLYMRHYYAYFINDNWPWFRQVFTSFNGDKQSLERQMAFLCDVRNPLAHANGHFLSPDEITRADEYCSGLIRQIDEYMENNP